MLLEAVGRQPTAAEREQLGRWHGWGAAGQLFDRPEFAEERARLQALIGADGLAAAARTTLNAHYTDPAIVEAMWATLDRLAPGGGVFVEPGCGRGSFLHAAPGWWAGLGVELDPTTARVARALADPRHTVVTGDFARVPLAAGADGFIGNVPFGAVRLFDPDANPGRRLSIHDHFVAKAAAALVPGGVGVVITSRYTLDRLDPAAREAIGAHADFLGAVRLPSTAHQVEAGTRVVTDVLVLRRRAAGQPARHAAGWDTPPVTIDRWAGRALAEPVRICAHYTANPERVAGQVAVEHGLHAVELVVHPTGDPAAQLAAALDELAGAVIDRDTAGVTRLRAVSARRDPAGLVAEPPARPPAPVGRIEADGDGYRRAGPAGWEDHQPPAGQRAELDRLLRLRDLADRLVDAEADPTRPETDVEDLRARLGAAHADYVERHGPVNRVTVNPDTNRRTTPRLGGFRSDPGFARVAALEIYDEQTGTATPAALLRHRVIRPPVTPERAATPADALALCLRQRGRVDLDHVAALLDTNPEQAAADLAGADRIYIDPDHGRWVTAEEYLSGNVRAKLSSARDALGSGRADLAGNVAALQAVQPVDVVATDLTGTLGAPWVEPGLVAEFARSLLPPGHADAAATISVFRAEVTGQWTVQAGPGARAATRVGHPYGSADYDALRLIQDRLNGRPTVVTHDDGDGRQVVDAEATASAAERAEALSDHFDAWLLVEDPHRSAAVLARYNDTFNAHVARSYRGVRVDPPGLRDGFVLRDHQHQAIARMVTGGNTLLAHPVGAGKTAEMIVGAMELARLGTIRLPAFVVPNHLLGQFARDVVDLYPAAHVLAVDVDDVNPAGRALFAARVRSNAWDAVVISHSSFARWPLSPAALAADLEGRLDARRHDLERAAQAGAGRTLTKQLERSLLAEEEKLKAHQARTAGRWDAHHFYFDHSGVDYVCLDEAHEFKNAELASSARNLRGVAVSDGSLRSQDLAAKLRWLSRAHPDRPTVTFATGTPVSNTAAEIWVMARYLRPDLCAQLGVAAFDDFRAQFCDTTSAMELDPSGTQLRRVERLARYKNLPELARFTGEFADVVPADQLNLPRPRLAGGARRTVVIQPADGLARFMADTVSERADAIRNRRVDPRDDNMLKLTSDCRAASFDWAGYSGDLEDPGHSVLARAAEEIAAIYHAHRDDRFATHTGQPHPRPGALQLVFADLGTPKRDRDDTAYDRLRAFLADRGVPHQLIAFVHDHDRDDDTKARFFDMCRDGRVAVAVSSTAKMGMGTNVQDRLVALHHLDCPWRPSDVEQREGRILRQGNQHPEIEIVAYTVEGSFSAYAWQTVERKAGFIGQLLRADPAGPRSLDAGDDETLSYGQIKALATGDPAFIELAELEDRIARLTRVERAHSHDQAAIARRHQHLLGEQGRLRTSIDALAPVAQRVTDARSAQPAPARATWTVEVAGRSYDNRAEAARALRDRLIRPTGGPVLRFVHPDVSFNWRPGPYPEPGRLQLATPTPLPAPAGAVTVDDRSPNGLIGALIRATNLVDGLPDTVQRLRNDLTRTSAQLDLVIRAEGAPFKGSAELASTKSRYARVAQELAARYAPDDTPRATPAAGDAGPVTASPVFPTRPSPAPTPFLPRRPDRGPQLER